METNQPAETTSGPVPRLCNEIQLFDLCELEQCRDRDGRFCTRADLLARFERIAEQEEAPRVQPGQDELDDEDGETDLAGDWDVDGDCEEEYRDWEE